MAKVNYSPKERKDFGFDGDPTEPKEKSKYAASAPQKPVIPADTEGSLRVKKGMNTAAQQKFNAGKSNWYPKNEKGAVYGGRESSSIGRGGGRKKR